MKLHFFGTGSFYPSPSRGASSLCLQFDDGSCWLFDCGEGTQTQVQKSDVSLNRIKKIFITHLHGDHLYGLPGLISTKSVGMADVPEESMPVVDIYGPTGLQQYLNFSLYVTGTRLSYKYKVHELMPIECQKKELYERTTENRTKVPFPCEIEGKDVHPVQDECGNYTWNLFEEGNYTVTAGWIEHRLPSFGFVIKEKEKGGALQVSKLKELGIKAGPHYAKLKSGMDLEIDGRIIKSSEVTGEPIPGRTIAILGDTSNALPMSHLVKECTVLVHECTHDDTLIEKSAAWGHSTPSMAVKIAKAFGAETLVLNHFSQRYRNKGHSDMSESVEILEKQALDSVDQTNIKVVISHDLMCLNIPTRK